MLEAAADGLIRSEDVNLRIRKGAGVRDPPWGERADRTKLLFRIEQDDAKVRIEIVHRKVKLDRCLLKRRGRTAPFDRKQRRVRPVGYSRTDPRNPSWSATATALTMGIERSLIKARQGWNSLAIISARLGIEPMRSVTVNDAVPFKGSDSICRMRNGPSRPLPEVGVRIPRRL
jgi:hypothetical protein